jgi:SAM-dependent methyltransferase
MLRTVEPEILDALAADDPRAVRTRRELRLVNRLMGNAGIVARRLRIADGARIADLGSGDATFIARVARKLRPRPRGVQVTLVDRECPPSPEALASLRALGWEARHFSGDALQWLARAERLDAIAVNLFLHHFHTPRLRELLRLAAKRTPLFVACEPRRSALALAGSHALVLLGFGAVTRHDSVASVKAGFRDRELSAAWPAGGGWRLEERSSGPFAHIFVARRP